MPVVLPYRKRDQENLLAQVATCARCRSILWLSCAGSWRATAIGRRNGGILMVCSHQNMQQPSGRCLDSAAPASPAEPGDDSAAVEGHGGVPVARGKRSTQLGEKNHDSPPAQLKPPQQRFHAIGRVTRGPTLVMWAVAGVCVAMGCGPSRDWMRRSRHSLLQQVRGR